MVRGGEEIILPCTKELANTTKNELQVYVELEVGSYYVWHVSIYQFERAKYVLMMNDRNR